MTKEDVLDKSRLFCGCVCGMHAGILFFSLPSDVCALDRVVSNGGVTLTAQVRQSIGICPQHDALMPLLTAREHIEMYMDIKGMLPELKG